MGPRTRSAPVLKLVATFLLLAIAAIHLNLYVREDYNKIPVVGWLFLLTAISAVGLAVVVVVRPTWLVEAATGLFALGVLGAYLLTLWLPEGLFSFKEPGVSYSGAASLAVEAATVLVSGALVFRRARSSRVSPSMLLAS